MRKTISFFTLFILLLSHSFLVNGQNKTTITYLRVQSSEKPLAIEDKKPNFGWQMNSSAKGQKQDAYQIVVIRDKDKTVVWDSKNVVSSESVNIQYGGTELQPESTYSWNLTVWDASSNAYNESSKFETGLMNSSVYSWSGAKWIGNNDIPLDAASSMVFDINTDFQIIKGNTVSLILGANDFRFGNKFFNTENLAGENYARFELDVSGVGTPKGVILNIYRVCYGPNDSAETPKQTISVEKYPQTNINTLFTPENKNSVHTLNISVEASDIYFSIDGTNLILAPAPPANTNNPDFFVGGLKEGLIVSCAR